MSSIQPYQISIPQAKLDKLKTKLSLVDFPDELEGSGWDLGCPLDEIKRLTKAWEEWDWRHAEKKLNEYPQFHTDIEIVGFGSLDIHFLHQKSNVAGAIPLLLVHGWPGLFTEFLRVLPLLSISDGPAFHVVVPSLPNFGFSQGPSKRGFGTAQLAETCHKLMLKLGYDRYVTQGGDIGFGITRALGALYPKSCKASHFNMVRAAAPTFKTHPLLAIKHAVTPYTEKEKEGFATMTKFSQEESDKLLISSLSIKTLAYSLNDSPVALLAWIYEKLHTWSDHYLWTDDEILTWIGIYQFSRAGPGASVRIYYESRHTPQGQGPYGRTFTPEDGVVYNPTVKIGLCYNPKELYQLPKSWGRTLGEVVYESNNDHGGHFCAHEHPEVLARDLKAMFGKGGGAYGVVKGKSGYDD